MKKLFLGLAGVACSLVFMAQPALASPQNDKTTDNTYSAEVDIVDQSGEHSFPIAAQQTLSQFLASKGLTIADYRYGDNKALDGNDTLSDKEITKIYKVSSTGKSELVDLPIPVQEVKTDALLIGKTQVKDEGAPGKLLKTVVVTGLKGSAVNDTSETLIVLEAPKPKVILVGTKEPVVTPPAPTQGVDAPWATTDAKTKEAIKNGISDNKLVNVLAAQVGKPYVWGAEGPSTFDCSGLVYYVMNQSGIKVPRVTASDYGAMAKPVSMKDIQPGDIFWNNQHIGIYAGNGKVIHAANPRVGVIISSLDYFSKGDYHLGRLS